MYAQKETPKENKNRSVADSVVQKKSGVNQSFGFVDNRPEISAQRKLQKIANNTPQTKQLRANFPPVMQLNRDEDKEPFVELTPEVKEKKTRVKTGLLGNALKADDNVRERKSEKNRPPSREAHYLFHSTTYKNLITILSKGLDPDKGGSEIGASALAEGKLRDDSIKGSENYVHGASQSEVALHYASKFDAKEKQEETREGAGFSVVLRFLVGGKDNWTEDTEDSRGNYKTQKVIPSEQIEFLEAGSGWQPLTSIDLSVLKALETEKSLVPVSPVKDITPKASARTGVVEERNLSQVNMSPDGKY